MLSWNVFYGDWNSKDIKTFNIFSDYILNEIKNAYKKFSTDKEKFFEEVRHILMYYYWSKCEWETVISHWPTSPNFNSKKIDVYWQIYLNWDSFCEYLWNHKEELKRINKKV